MRSGFGILILLLCVPASNSAVGQTRVEAHACTAAGRDYTCDKHSFEEILTVAKTISVQASRSDPYSLKQLDKLARSLGKMVRPDSADLTLVLSRPEPDGIYYGPSDKKLATIRVYYRGSANNGGKLVWVENYFGQPGTAWPITVDHLTRKFRKDIQQ